MKTKAFFSVLSVAILTLSACSSVQEPLNTDSSESTQHVDDLFTPLASETDDDSVASEMDDASLPIDEHSVMSEGNFQADTPSGGRITFRLPPEIANTDFYQVADIENYRQEVNGPTASYIAADVDNAHSDEVVSLAEIEVAGTDGNNYIFGTAYDYLEEIKPIMDWHNDGERYSLVDGTVLPRHDGYDLYEQAEYLHSHNEPIVNNNGRGMIVMIYEGVDFPEEFTSVTLRSSDGSEEFKAYPANL